MSFLHNMNEGTDTNYLEQFCIQWCSYNNKLTSEQNTLERNPLFQLAYDLQLQHANMWHNGKSLLVPLTFISLQYCANPCLTRKLFLNYRFIHVCTTIGVPFIYFYTLVYLLFVFVSILILQNNQNSMLLYDCIYLIKDNLNSSF